MADPDRNHTLELAGFIDASPSPFHAVESVAAMLAAGGFVEEVEAADWSAPRRGFVRQGGALIAWSVPPSARPVTPMRLIGAHTDSPNLRIKPRPETGAVDIGQLGVEVYGGALLNSWLDRDLGLSGRVAVADNGEVREHLVRVDRPVLRVSQLAIHLDREVNERGLVLDRQRHLAPMWCAGSPEPGAFARWLASEVGLDAGSIDAWDLMVHDLTPSRLVGADESWFAAPRIDNLASCFAGTRAMLASTPSDVVAVLCLFDHEEVGSTSSTGAAGTFLPRVLRRIGSAMGGTGTDLDRALAGSICISADGAHATHPNYVERHEPDHRVALNGGPVIKRNSNERYATNAVGHAVAVEACRAAGVPHQLFVTRSDLACGSTIGPVTAAQLGITTVDLGMPQLSMHSARELCGADDPAYLIAALTAFLSVP